MVMIKNNVIQMMVDRKPMYTSGSSIDQPLLKMDRSAVVAIVSGRPCEMNL